MTRSDRFLRCTSFVNPLGNHTARIKGAEFNPVLKLSACDILDYLAKCPRGPYAIWIGRSATQRLANQLIANHRPMLLDACFTDSAYPISKDSAINRTVVSHAGG
jgi:hypothetical protein